MPLSRDQLEAHDDRVASGTNTAAVLSLLARNPDEGYESKEIAAATPVPQNSVDKVLQQLRAEGLVVELSDHYLVNTDRLDDIEDMLLTTKQFDVAAAINDRDTTPAEVDVDGPEDIDTPNDDILTE